ncbi:PREDICTED: leucine-rich repeat-containing protein 47-like [Dinoponera quadriceps]|uniref:Leucine-rich repeat-containing protein 47-like n=1 Tax=Dinoponera quadriceps TaxID=609295 RepID=A0A6P3XYV2_DINQU|nr:PREDICTED: leucine-rich repeat-containing protein 47-like [Dinoponera quadriceps]
MTLKDSWEAVRQAADENRHELVLTGTSVSKLIEKSGLDENLFDLHNLNYLCITQTCLQIIPDEIEKLTNLTTLVLHSNQIATLPDTIGKLIKIKLLDCSRNKLTSLPQALDNFPQLSTMNFGSNLLRSIPSQSANIKLNILDLSNNRLETFPDVCYAELVHLSEIYVNGNRITEIPAAISQLQVLKVLNIADNLISVVPGELADCGKLKEINLKDNKLTDKRLLKLVNQCRSKQVLDYVKLHCPKCQSSAEVGRSKKGKKNQKLSESENANKVDNLTHKLRILKVADSTPVIKVTDSVKSIRPYIAACIVRNMNFTEASFKRFIQLQTKLHDGICDRRNAATIATHDFKLIPSGDLTYTAMRPAELQIRPLMRNNTCTAEALFQQLQTEADNLRKEKKRNVYSGIHKYLYMLEGKPLFPCFLDSSQRVISLPPITNSDVTKMSSSTETMFVEVTSGISYTVCRKVLDEFLKELVTLDFINISEQEDTKYNNLIVEQIKVVDTEGNLKLVYPSRVDLNLDEHSITVLREQQMT